MRSRSGTGGPRHSYPVTIRIPVKDHSSATKLKYPMAKRRSGLMRPNAVSAPPSSAASRKTAPAGRRAGFSTSKDAPVQLGYISDQKKVVFAYKIKPGSQALNRIEYSSTRPRA